MHRVYIVQVVAISRKSILKHMIDTYIQAMVFTHMRVVVASFVPTLVGTCTHVIDTYTSVIGTHLHDFYLHTYDWYIHI